MTEGWCEVDDCPVNICNGPHVEHFCPNGDRVVQHFANPEPCPFCGAAPAASQPASPPGEGTPADDIEHDEGGSGCCARGFCGPERQARFAPGEGTR